jgi:hypothetical protein
MTHARSVRLILASAAVSLLVPVPVRAQSSFVAELTEAGHVDLSIDFLGSVARRDAGGFEWYLPSVTFGVSDRLDIGGALSVTAPFASEPREAIPYARWQWLDTARGQTALFGAAAHLPLTRDDAAPYGAVFGTFAQTLGERRPATITVGAYSLAGRTGGGETRSGLVLGWDQTFASRWSASVEWTSGTNWYGYFSSGLTFSRDAAWVTAGYCLGNDRAANHGPCVSAGQTF